MLCVHFMHINLLVTSQNSQYGKWSIKGEGMEWCPCQSRHGRVMDGIETIHADNINIFCSHKSVMNTMCCIFHVFTWARDFDTDPCLFIISLTDGTTKLRRWIGASMYAWLCAIATGNWTISPDWPLTPTTINWSIYWCTKIINDRLVLWLIFYTFNRLNVYFRKYCNC